MLRRLTCVLSGVLASVVGIAILALVFLGHPNHGRSLDWQASRLCGGRVPTCYEQAQANCPEPPSASCAKQKCTKIGFVYKCPSGSFDYQKARDTYGKCNEVTTGSLMTSEVEVHCLQYRECASSCWSDMSGIYWCDSNLHAVWVNSNPVAHQSCYASTVCP